MRAVRILGRAAIVVMCLALPSCAIVDQYADRAATYNLEAEQAQEKGILLNIIRASLRRPMQFTSVTSIAGSTSATGSGGYSGPVSIPFRLSGGTAGYPNLTTWTAGGSMSGSETFTVPVLDTQEFYQGILKPIPSQYLDLLIQQRYPMDLLFNLFIQKVVMRDTDKEKCAGVHTEQCEYIFTNYVSRDDDIVLFQLFAHFLIRAGLTTESAESRKDNLLRGAVNINVKLLGSAGQAGTSGQSSGDGGTGGSQSAEPLPKNYVFCFAPKSDAFSISPHGGCGTAKKPAAFQLGENPSNVVTVEQFAKTVRNPITKKEEYVVRALPECSDAGFKVDPRHAKFCEIMESFAKKNSISFTFYPKSTEAVIYYLGEVARRYLYPDFGNQPLQILIATPPDYTKDFSVDSCVQPPQKDASLVCPYLFQIDWSPVSLPGTIWSLYDGSGFLVKDYLHGGGYSMSSLEIVKQLVALFSSAKSLPQTTVLNVVGSP